MNFGGFRLRFLVHLSSRFDLAFSIVVLQITFLIWPRAQTPDMRKMQHPPHEHEFFKGALSRQRRQKDDETGTKRDANITSTNLEI